MASNRSRKGQGVEKKIEVALILKLKEGFFDITSHYLTRRSLLTTPKCLQKFSFGTSFNLMVYFRNGILSILPFAVAHHQEGLARLQQLPPIVMAQIV
jgi:hypothetical protein